ncbi:MAG: GTP 3',8-cyclase MoaA [Planctomycetes bacterium]|nr:GTP 3',8-cyclase MoaA [Planctomycetota bacterium]
MISLPIIDAGPQRPVFANGPRSLASVKLLRLSITDRCNLRCVYCMPDDGVQWMAAQPDLLTPADFQAVSEVAASLGITHFKITGGEPTVRSDLVEIVKRIRAIPGVRDLSLTTNGILFDRYAVPLKEAGLDRVTFSIDSLKPDRFATITRGGKIEQFWAGMHAAEQAGYTRTKINVVMMAGMNDDEVADFARLTLDHDWTVRFIEYMPLGESGITASADPDAAIVDNQVLMARLGDAFGPLQAVDRATEVGVGPAHVYRVPGGVGRLGFISAMSQPFCETCNRLRLTAIGELRSCLFDGGEIDLRPALRPKPDKQQLAGLFEQCATFKPETHSHHGNRAMSQLGG